MEPCPQCGQLAYERVVALLHACRSCDYIAEGLVESKIENTDPLVKKLVNAIFDAPRYQKMIIDEARSNGIEVISARGILPESWLNQERFEWFRKGHEYASTQTQAIKALASSSPEDLYYAACAFLRGARMAGKAIPEE